MRLGLDILGHPSCESLSAQDYSLARGETQALSVSLQDDQSLNPRTSLTSVKSA